MSEASAEPLATPLDFRKNPFTLVYDGALTKNEPGKVNIHPVKYKLHGLDIVANVYTPAGYDPAKKYPALVVAHPNGGVKEQTAGLYAQHLAERGYITIAMDAAYQGGGGEPRSVDTPSNRIEDIHATIFEVSAPPAIGHARSCCSCETVSFSPLRSASNAIFPSFVQTPRACSPCALRSLSASRASHRRRTLHIAGVFILSTCKRLPERDVEGAG